jgi:hypothetical protein
MTDTQLPPEQPPTAPKPPEYWHPGGSRKPSILRRWNNDAVFRRRFVLGSGVAAIVVIVPVTATLTALALTSNANIADRLTAAGDVLVGATLLLGAAAALVTLLAFMAATGVPSLRLQLACEGSQPNNPVFRADELETSKFQARQPGPLSGRIVIWNDSNYPAREPRVIVRLNAMAFTAGPGHLPFDGWTVLDIIDTVGTTAIEWEGGAGYSVHPNSVRHLPGFQLNNLRWNEEWGKPGFTIEILLDNLRQVVYLPVEFEVDGKYLAVKDEDRGTVAPWKPSPRRKQKPARPTPTTRRQLQLPRRRP